MQKCEKYLSATVHQFQDDKPGTRCECGEEIILPKKRRCFKNVLEEMKEWFGGFILALSAVVALWGFLSIR